MQRRLPKRKESEVRSSEWALKSPSFGFAEEEQAALLDGFAAGAREVGGGGDSAEQDEPVPERAVDSFIWLFIG